MFITRVLETFAVIVLGATGFGSTIGGFIAVFVPFIDFNRDADSLDRPSGCFIWLLLTFISWLVAAFLLVLGSCCFSEISHITTGRYLDW